MTAPVTEPADSSVRVDVDGTVWVRYDTPWRSNWWALRGDNLVVADVQFDWVLIRGNGLVKADAALTAAALDRVRAFLAAEVAR